MKAAVEDLLTKKVKMSEFDKAPKIDKINQYIEEKLEYYKELLESMTDDRNPDWEPLNQVFISLVERCVMRQTEADRPMTTIGAAPAEAFSEYLISLEDGASQ